MADNKSLNYDPCQPPICEDLIIVRIITYSNSIDNCDNIYITWCIDNLPTGIIPSLNNILWSFNNQTFSNSSPSQTNTQNYYTNFSAPQGPGLLYFKARATINGKFYESETYSIIIGDSSCEVTSSSSSSGSRCGLEDISYYNGDYNFFNQTYWIGTTDALLFRYQLNTMPDEITVTDYTTGAELFHYGPGITEGWEEVIISTIGIEYINVNVNPGPEGTTWKFEIRCSSSD